MNTIQSEINESHKEKGAVKKQSPEEMIREMQGIFCGGRYRSWVVSRDKEERIRQPRP